MKRYVRPELPLIVASDLTSAVVGRRMVADGLAYGLVYVEDRAGGGLTIEYVVGAGHEPRLLEIEALIRDIVEQTGACVVDGARLGRRGAA